jgi:ribulose 1,5-bisphosphate synthetase/thiazole synthase
MTDDTFRYAVTMPGSKEVMSDSAKSAAVTTHVVIVGADFAGLNCAKKLASDSSLRITLIDKNNYHQFQPRHGCAFA